MSKTLLDEKIEKIQNIVDIQCSAGNYDYDPYMHGMANGMLVVLSCLTEKEPEFMEAPKKWLKDSTETHVLTSQ